MGEVTISNTIKEYRETKLVKSPSREKHQKNVTTKTEKFDKYTIQRKIRQFWINRELPT